MRRVQQQVPFLPDWKRVVVHGAVRSGAQLGLYFVLVKLQPVVARASNFSEVADR